MRCNKAAEDGLLHTMNAFCLYPFRATPLRHDRLSRVCVMPSIRSVTTPYAKASKSSRSPRNKRPRASRSSLSSSSSSASDLGGFGIASNSRSENTDDGDGNENIDEDVISNGEHVVLNSAARDFNDTINRKKRSKEMKARKKASERTDDSDRTRDLNKLDSNGISMEHRLREEILHPLRKPKQTLFGTLAFSATLGFFFACGRLVVEKDSLVQVGTNVTIDVAAVALFGYLTWREFEFGRRSLNSIAGIPQPRDLPIVRFNSESNKTSTNSSDKSRKRPSSFSSSSVSSLSASGENDGNQLSKIWRRLTNKNDNERATEATDRLGTLLKSAGVVVVVAGRAVDVARYVERCARDAGYNDFQNNPSLASEKFDSTHPALVAFITDSKEANVKLDTAAAAVAAGSPDEKADWVAWLADAVPPRRNIVLFRVEKENGGTDAAGEYIVTVDDPDVVPLPADARRLTVVEV